MISRDTTNTPRPDQASREPEFRPHNDRRSRRFGTHEIGDDVIVALESAYENQRARQVTEWETIGQLTFRQSA